MITAGAVFAIIIAVSTAADLNITDTKLNRIDKRLRDRLVTILESNRTLDPTETEFLIKTAKNLNVDSDLVTKFIDIVSIKNSTEDEIDVAQNTEDSTPTYIMKRDETKIDHISLNNGPIEESPDYASSVVLASDLLSLTRAVSSVKDNVCRDQGFRFLDGLLLKKRWALEMFDASAKSPQGLLFGSSYHLGNYDECIHIKENTDSGPMVEGQYCLPTIDWPEAKAKKMRGGSGGSIRWAVCVPSTCDAPTVANFVSDIIADTIGTNISVTITGRDCSTRRPLTVNGTDIGYLSFIIVFVAIIFLSSVYDIISSSFDRKRISTVHDVIISFSIINNIRKIISTKQNTGLGLECVAGIKALSMCLILFGHACMFSMGGPVMNLEAITEQQQPTALSSLGSPLQQGEEGTKSLRCYIDFFFYFFNYGNLSRFITFNSANLNRVPIYGFMLNSMLLVDTFLMLSAFLFCRLLLLELDNRKGRLNVLPILVFRYIRVTPAYLVVILFYMTWLPKIGDGPIWRERIEVEQERCVDSWWANLLYINNYVNPEKLCMFQSWYLAVDTQLFFVAPIFIYSLWKWRRVGLLLLFISTVTSLIVPSVITYERSLDPTLLVYAEEVRDLSTNYYFSTAYIKTHMKMTPYCIGLLTGYVLYRVQKENYQLSKLVKSVSWTFSITVGIVVAFSVSVFYQEWYHYSRLGAAAYVSLHKVGWCLVNGWLLIACATGNGGIFQKLFSFKFLIPISRLTYCAYLVNGIIELFYTAQIQQPMHFTPLNLGATAISHVALTFFLALILCITFESPIHGIEKIILKIFDRRVLSDNLRNASSEVSRDTSQSRIDS